MRMGEWAPGALSFGLRSLRLDAMLRTSTSPLGLARALLALACVAALAAGCKDAPTPDAAAPAPALVASAPAVAEAPAVAVDLPGISAVPAGEERAAVLQTVTLIRKGGPFPFPAKDGTVFQNRERQLPRQPRGYYHEYTVPTRGVSHRGARRIVGGRERELFYSRDHYQTFLRLTP